MLGQKTGNDYITYLYDENGTAYGIIHNDSYYYYVFNAQGDVIKLLDNSGNIVVQYEYNSWGKILSITNGNGEDVSNIPTNIGNINPLRYRGYYYDIETGFYSLQSRYYDPETCRFINADSQLNTTAGLTGYNMFCYCANNPVNNIDPDGHSWKSIKKWCTDKLSKLSERLKPVKENIQKANNIIKKVDKTVGAAIFSFDIKAGVGSGLRGGVKIAGAEISGGAKADLATLKLSYNKIDLGNECLASIGVDTPIPKAKLEVEEGEICSWISDTTDYYNSDKVNTNIELAGIDLYFIVVASASISFNYSTFNNMCIEIWGE